MGEMGAVGGARNDHRLEPGEGGRRRLGGPPVMALRRPAAAGHHRRRHGAGGSYGGASPSSISSPRRAAPSARRSACVAAGSWSHRPSPSILRRKPSAAAWGPSAKPISIAARPPARRPPRHPRHGRLVHADRGGQLGMALGGGERDVATEAVAEHDGRPAGEQLDQIGHLGVDAYGPRMRRRAAVAAAVVAGRTWTVARRRRQLEQPGRRSMEPWTSTTAVRRGPGLHDVDAVTRTGTMRSTSVAPRRSARARRPAPPPGRRARPGRPSPPPRPRTTPARRW